MGKTLRKKCLILSFALLTATIGTSSLLYANDYSQYSFMPDIEEEKDTDEEEDYSAKVESLSVKMDGEKVILTGKTSGFTDQMLISIKVFNESEQLKFFDVITLNKNAFSVSFIPKDVKPGESLMVKIGGDLVYIEEFAYGESKDTDPGLIFDSTLLDNYIKNELGQFIDKEGTLSFVYEYAVDKNKLSIKMKGTDFAVSEPVWKNKDQSRWKSYLEIIADKALEFYNLPVTIQVFDKNSQLIDAYTKSTHPAQGLSVSEMKALLNKEYGYFSSSKGTLRFTYEVKESKAAYFITMKGKFNGADAVWKNVDKKELSAFISMIGQNLEHLVYKDLKFTLVDNKDAKLSGFDYFVNNKPPKKTYLYLETLNDIINAQKPKPDDNISGNILNMIQYGGISFGDQDLLTNASSHGVQVSLKNSQIAQSKVKSKQTIVIKIPELADVYTITLPNDFIGALIRQQSKLILAMPEYEMLFDFEGISATPFALNVEIRKDAINPSNANFTIHSNVESSFKVTPKGIIRYQLKETLPISDTRTLAVFKSDISGQNDSIVPYSLKIEKQGVQFDYMGKGNYYLKNNEKYFTDMQTHWGKNQINLLSAKEIIQGIGDQQYAPERTITRAEFISMLVRNLGLIQKTSSSAFKDITINDWYYHSVNSAKNAGILPSTYKDQLKPNQPITREEMIYMVIECYELNPNLKQVGPSALFYKDRKEVSDWAVENVSKAGELGLARGYENRITPKATATRAEAAQILINLLEKQFKL